MQVGATVTLFLAMLMVVSGCSDKSSPEQALDQSGSDLAWSKCIFELDKIEALRGRNLDDLDIGLSSARNQFMLDCMTAHDAPITVSQTLEMAKYAVDKEKRNAKNMTLNSGNRTLPEDPTKAVKAAEAE